MRRMPTTTNRARRAVPCLVACLLLAAPGARAEDWPEFRGKGRLGVWYETGILERFPAEGLDIAWRTPLNRGYAGPAVADGRVFVSDFERTSGMTGIERAVCLDERTGEMLWTYEWEANYAGISWDEGPRATPTVDGDRVYVQGAAGTLVALNAETGELLWTRNFREEFGADMPIYGFASSPLVDGERLITLAGGVPDAKVMAFDKMTGDEVWRALSSEESGPGVGQPVIIEASGVRQLIVWHPVALSSLDPDTGEVFWEQPFTVDYDMTVAAPVKYGSELFVTTFYNGPLMMTLDADRPDAAVHWKGESNSEILTEGLHSVLATPVIMDGYIYRRRQLRTVALPRGRDRRAHLGDAGRDGGARQVGERLHRAPRGSLLHQQRPRRPDHRAHDAGRLRGDQPDAPDCADLRAGQPARAEDRQLVAPGVRQPAHLRPQRRRDHRRVAGGSLAAAHVRGRSRKCVKTACSRQPAWVAPAGPVTGRSRGGRAQPRDYFCRAQADRYRPSGIRVRSITWQWIQDSRLRRLSTRRQGLQTTGGAAIDSQYRAVAPSRRGTARRHPPAHGGGGHLTDRRAA